jgi:predicted O-linked N-acetylglucosamine transferase (SPINDLY family)
MYRRMGIADCIAGSPEEYVQIAVRLGTDPAWREEICARIRESRGVLFENHAFVRELEDTLEKMVRQPALLPVPTFCAQAQEMQAGA